MHEAAGTIEIMHYNSPSQVGRNASFNVQVVNKILPLVRVTIDGILDLSIGFIALYTFTQFGTIGSAALSLFYTLQNSPLYTRTRVLSLH
jgi:hypothetical protein